MMLTIDSSSISTMIQAQCVEEFGICVMNRDCCDDLDCITGDWQYTTDSTCLSKRSEQIDNLSMSTKTKISLIEEYYNRDEVVNRLKESEKSKQLSDFAKNIVKRYDQNFPQLISRLEAKYGLLFEFEGVGNHVEL